MNKEQKQLLEIISAALFRTPVTVEADSNELLQEAMMQAVQPLVYSVIKSKLKEEERVTWKKMWNHCFKKSLRIEYEHIEVNELMSQHQIPYVIVKGYASGFYYPEASLRSYGDVDFLVYNKDMEKAGKLLESYGFEKAVQDDGKSIHIAYHRAPNSVWELHRSLNGIPSGDYGECIQAFLSDIIETSCLVSSDNGEYRIPDTFHHGLVLLLHTASHLTSEGIGLRHLCDWAVFVEHVPEFESIFQEKLKKCGLWKFARLLTLVSVKYIGLPEQEWAGEADEELLELLMEDILSGGNFGKKAEYRYAQIKYIKNRGEGTVDKKSPISQVLYTIWKKAEQEEKSSIAVMIDYIRMIMQGKRKLDNRDVVKGAEKRKRLYAELNLYE